MNSGSGSVARGLALWLFVVAVAVAGWRWIPELFWPYAFLLRVPLVMGLLLFALPFIAIFVVPSVLKNLYVMRGKWQVAFSVLASIVSAMAVVSVGAIIAENAHDRFALPAPPPIPDPLYFVLAILLCLPSIVAITSLSRGEIRKETWIGLLLGLALGGGFIFIFESARNLIGSEQVLAGSGIIGSIDRILVTMILFLGRNQEAPGYINPANGRLNSAHLDGFAFFIALLAVYLVTFSLYRPRISRPTRNGKRHEAAALYHAILLLGIGTLFLGNLTFFFDYWRLSVLFFWLAITAGMYYFFRVDHFFSILPSGRGKENEGGADSRGSGVNPDFLSFLRTRLAKQTVSEPLADRTLVIICASGGGIQAAGWTTQVLKGLQEELSESFTRAIGLISSVSGGSVGCMYYLDQFEPQGFPPEDRLETSFRSATEDSLDAVSWGLAYPDLWRLLSLPFLPKLLPEQLRDRGRTIEVDWQGEMREPETPKRLSDLRKQVEVGTIPLPVMNATSVEDGFRCLISPLSFAGVSADKAHDFQGLYPEADLSLVTAARLSATFPYVSPVCRDDGNLRPRLYFADGGYFDNSGFVTALEWLMKLLRSEDCFLRRVLILQINPFPENPPDDSAADDRASRKTTKGRGFFMATLGPVLAIFKVRDPVLDSRNRIEADLLKTWSQVKAECEQKSIDIRHFPIYFPSLPELSRKSGKRATELFSKDGYYQPPLSWKLTENQKQLIKDAWKSFQCDEVFKSISALWEKTWNMKG